MANEQPPEMSNSNNFKFQAVLPIHSHKRSTHTHTHDKTNGKKMCMRATNVGFWDISRMKF